MKRIVLVYGPPGAGKSTYVAAEAKKNDIIFDLDKLHEAMSPVPGLHRDRKHMLSVSMPMRDAFLDAIQARKGDWDTAWVITGSANKKELRQMISRLGAEPLPVLRSPEECISAIQSDQSREDKSFQAERVSKWFQEFSAEPEASARDSFAKWFDNL